MIHTIIFKDGQLLIKAQEVNGGETTIIPLRASEMWLLYDDIHKIIMGLRNDPSRNLS